MIPVEEVIAALPKARQRAIEVKGRELLARVARRMTLVATFPNQEPVVIVTGTVKERLKAAGKKKERKNAA
jgi:hypothetical protein